MKSDVYRLRRIADIGNQLLDVVDSYGITAEALQADFKLQWLVSTPLFDIGEQVNCLSSRITEAYPDQPWTNIAGLRHRLVHHYEGTDWRLVGAVLSDELRPFVERVEAILKELESE